MCVTCNSKDVNFSLVATTCRVCELIDNDTRNKPAAFCEFCGAYICQPCWDNAVRRAHATALDWGRKIEGVFKKSSE